MKRFLFSIAIALMSPHLMAATPPSGQARATAVCAACHGANGVSVAEHIPHLAGQRAAYLQAQLEAFREGTRKSEVMNAIARQLAPEEPASLAAYFAALPAADAKAKSALMASVSTTHVSLPARFDTGYRRYLVKSDEAALRVAIYYASEVAFAAAAEGRPLPDGSGIFVANYTARVGADQKPVRGADGHFVPDQLLSTAAMARDAGWGREIPDLLRNENWNYALFDAKGERRQNINQAECLACHKPQAATSFLFLHRELAAAARR